MSSQLNEDDLMKKTMQQLCDWVLDDGKIVTCSYLLKNTALSVEQVQILLKQFIDQNITDGRVNSTFLLMVDYLQTRRIGADKLQFKSVDTCSIYSVQAKPIRDFQSLFNVNWSMEGSPYLSPVKNKSLIWNPAAHDFYIRWKESRQDDVNRLENMTKHLLQKEMLRNATRLDDNKATASNDKAGRGMATHKFFKSESKTSPEKKKIQVIDASAPSPQTKRRRKVLTDDEEDEDEKEGHMNVETHTEQYNSTRLQQNMETEKSTSSTHPLNLMANGADDLYCTGGDSSPERKRCRSNMLNLRKAKRRHRRKHPKVRKSCSSFWQKLKC
uniref:Uncharacterized protein n=1 Tax=Ditylenchus dipsaci TaxID=166011 RepID=A0A915CXF2_9BILA